jgi:hypothetical protein
MKLTTLISIITCILTTACLLSSPIINPTNTPVPQYANFFMEWYQLVLSYDIETWSSITDPVYDKAALEHNTYKDCRIIEMGPSEYGGIHTQDIKLGDVTYELYESENLYRREYLAIKGFYNPDPSYIPFLIVVLPDDYRDTCLSDVEQVLSTLHYPYEIQTCTIGLKDSAAVLEITGPEVEELCDSLVKDSGNYYPTIEQPTKPIICALEIEGFTIIVRDEGLLKQVGNELCSSFDDIYEEIRK